MIDTDQEVELTVSGTRDVVMKIAEPGDLDDVLTILNAAATRLREKGIEQWPQRFDPDSDRGRRIYAEIARGNVNIVHHFGKPVATITCTDWCDPEFAHGWPDGPWGSLYVTRLATTPDSRELTGMSLGSLLLEHARFVAGLRGLSRVRLDCAKNNVALHDYYRRNLFDLVGVVDLPHRKSGALFEWRYDPSRRSRLDGAASR